MQYVRVASFATAVFWTVSGAWAQYGLSGSPQMLRLPTTGGGAIEQPVYPTAAGQPAPQVPSWAPRPMPAPGDMPTGAVHAASSAPFGPAIPGYLPAVQASPNYLVQATVAEPPIPPAPAASPLLPLSATGQAAPAPSVLDQLLQESGSSASAGTCGCAADGSVASDTCGDYLECEPCAVCPWYITAGGLMMGRNDANKVWTTYETNNNPNQILNTEDAGSDWRGGAEIRLGRRFCCGTWALEGTFWAVDEMKGFAGLASGGGGLSTPFNFSDVMFASDPDGTIDPGWTPDDLFDSADAHFISRVNEFYNVELNVLRSAMQSCGPFDADLLFGVRWFRFREHLTFQSLDQDGDWSDPEDVGYLDEKIENDLLGVQIGADVGCDLGYCLRLFARPKAGIFNNHIEHTFNAYSGAEQFVPRAGSGIVGTWPVDSDTDSLSFLTELDVGIDWVFHPQWSAFLGYRVLVATGIGLADHQLTTYVADIPEQADIDDNGTLILHGAFAGLKFNF